MVHTFQCLGVNVAVDVNSGAVHVLDELTYHLLELVEPPMGEHCPAEVAARLPQYDPAALEESYASLYPLHKMGKVSDMANAVKFLSSSEAGFITGEIMNVCGGSLI